MKKTVLVVFVLLFAAAAALYLVVSEGGRPRIPRPGDPAPQFALQSLDGRLVSLAEARGKVVLVHFWATWCPPCVEELPVLQRFYRSLEGGDVVLMAVSVDDSGPDAVRAFMMKHGLTIPVLLDPDKSVAESYGTFKFPETYLVDREGIIRNKLIGAIDWTRPEAGKMVEDLLKR
jgi:peroxiredoxin